MSGSASSGRLIRVCSRILRACVTSKFAVGIDQVVPDIWITRVEFQCSLQICERLLPSALALVDIRAPDQNVGVIRQHPAGHSERAAGLFKIADAVIITRLSHPDF